MAKIFLWVDDERKNPFENVPFCEGASTHTVRSYQATIEFLERCRDVHEVYIDLDHDLGEEKTGYDICKFIVSTNYPLIGFHLHTMNVVGRKNMEQLLTHYGYKNF